MPPGRIVSRASLGGAAFGAATLAANLLGYALVLVLARLLDPAALGAVGSLLSLSVIGAVPALALQLVIAGETARHLARTVPADVSVLLRPALATGALVGGGLGAAAGVLALPAAWFLHLDGSAAPLAVAAALPAAALTSAAQGVLQGARRFGALASVLVVVAGLRLVGGGLGGVLAPGPTGVVVGLLAATWLSTGLALAFLPRAVNRGAPPSTGPAPATEASRRPAEPRLLVRAVARGTTSTSGLLVLLNVDVLLARHVLPAEASGLYTVGSLFTKAAFWGPAFVSTLLFPGMAVAALRPRALRHGVAVTGLLGASCVVAVALLAGPAVLLAAGPGYSAVARDAVLFAALGAVLAVVQVLVYAGVAAADHRLGAAAWVAALGTALVVLFVVQARDLPAVVLTALTGAALLAAAGLVAERHVLLARATAPPGATTGAATPTVSG